MVVQAADSFAGQTGLALIVLNVLLDQVGLPVPAGPTLVVAGALAAAHIGWGAELFVLATTACVVADLTWFVAGRVYGNRVMRLLCRVSLSPDSCVSETQLRFERWGGKALVFAKFVPGLSIIAPPLAGALRMSYGRFVSLSTVGAALWVCVYLMIGAVLKKQIDAMLPYVSHYGARVLLLAGGLLAMYVAVRWWQRRRFFAVLRMARITVEELYELIEAAGSPVILDVRSHSARALEPRHIPNALHVPPDAVDEQLKHLPRDSQVVLYCTCPNEASAARVAKILIRHGFKHVRPLQGGLDAWVAAGYPVGVAASGAASRAA